MRGIIFVAFLFICGAGGLIFGSVTLYQYIDYHLNGRSALMQLPGGKKITLPVGGYDVFLLDVNYVGPDGELRVPQKQLIGDYARRLADGEKIPIIYLKSDPQHVLYSRDELPNPWGRLAIGAVGMTTFVFARRLLLRDAAAARSTAS